MHATHSLHGGAVLAGVYGGVRAAGVRVGFDGDGLLGVVLHDILEDLSRQ